MVESGGANASIVPNRKASNRRNLTRDKHLGADETSDRFVFILSLPVLSILAFVPHARLLIVDLMRKI